MIILSRFYDGGGAQNPKAVPAVDPEEQAEKDEGDPEDPEEVDFVLVDYAAEEDAESLAEGGVDGEDDGAEGGDGVEDEELSGGGAHGQEEAVVEEVGETLYG